ncbi:hypothetical protein [Methylobacterium indicum]|nr:hypothetical protein [Methylobacterium indicum]
MPSTNTLARGAVTLVAPSVARGSTRLAANQAASSFSMDQIPFAYLFLARRNSGRNQGVEKVCFVSVDRNKRADFFALMPAREGDSITYLSARDFLRKYDFVRYLEADQFVTFSGMNRTPRTPEHLVSRPSQVDFFLPMLVERKDRSKVSARGTQKVAFVVVDREYAMTLPSEGEPMLWSSARNFDKHFRFVRYLTADESVTINGMNRPNGPRNPVAAPAQAPTEAANDAQVSGIAAE